MAAFTLGELAGHVGGRVTGNGARPITGIRTLEEAGPEHLSFYHNRRYLAAARDSRAGALIVADAEPFAGRDLLVCADPYMALARLLALFHPAERVRPGVHPTAVMARTAQVEVGAAVGPYAVLGERVSVGTGAVLGAGCVVGDDVVVGEDTVLHPRVVIEKGCRVGARCILHAGVVIGADGFGFATSDGTHHKVPQVGVVVIEDDVELGANVCIDRATIGETRIGRGTKVDNLVQVGHNVRVGEHCLLVSQTGISGSTQLGHHVVLAGQVGVSGHLTLGNGTVATGQAGVTGDTAPGSMVSGLPARPHREWLRAMANLFQLEELRRRIADLEEAIERLGGAR